MGGILAIGELAQDRPSRLTLELATLARTLGDELGGSASVLLVGADGAAADELATHGSTVLLSEAGLADAPDAASVVAVAAGIIEREGPDIVLVGDTPDGKDVAGALVGLTDLPVLVAGAGIEAADGGVSVRMATFGGRLLTDSTFSAGGGIVLVRPGATTAAAAAQPAAVERLEPPAEPTLAPVSVIERVSEAAAGPSIDDARVVVAVGRGAGGEDGVALVGGLADAFGGALGATRAAVDSGWIDFGQQIGQTGKTVKPDLYIGCGISGAIQHKVGMQSSGTIIAINKDPDAPIVEFADLVIVGDLFEIVPRLTEAVRATDPED